jgi:hypothetical protein
MRRLGGVVNRHAVGEHEGIALSDLHGVALQLEPAVARLEHRQVDAGFSHAQRHRCLRGRPHAESCAAVSKLGAPGLAEVELVTHAAAPDKSTSERPSRL